MNTTHATQLQVFKQSAKVHPLPLSLARVSAGFPSPAEDFIDTHLDLNEHLVKHPAATFFVRVEGQSMKEVGIYNGDLLVVDRSLEAKNEDIIIAVLNGELTVKRIRIQRGRLFLAPENRHYQAIEVTSSMQFEVWGVVSSVIRKLKP